MEEPLPYPRQRAFLDEVGIDSAASGWPAALSTAAGSIPVTPSARASARIPSAARAWASLRLAL